MNQPRRLFSNIGFASLVLAAVCGHSQNLVPTAAPPQNWVSLASSADGVKLAAVGSYGKLYLSTNSGTTWQAAVTSSTGAEPQRPWTAVTSSADGARLAAVANFMPVFTSTNGGLTWRQTGPSAVWFSVASSADGRKLVAVDYQGGSIYLSKDGGDTWTAAPVPARRWRSVAASADASRLIAAADFGTNYNEAPGIFVSTNGGLNWTLTGAPAQPWQAMAVSADGSKLAAGAYGGQVYLSSDAGQSWTATQLPTARWGGIASSVDGSRLVAASWEGVVYVSADSGQTWTAANAPAATWQTVTCSADGTKVFAGIYDASGGGIYAAQPSSPTLTIKLSPSGTIVSWPAASSGYSLEERADFLSGTWQPVSATAIVTNGENQVVVNAAGGNRAYRLVQRQLASQ
jgi:photosystem II stability/assembly factor-like uncharacterized protein